MNMERAALRGRLAEVKKTKFELQKKAEGLCIAIRSMLNTALADSIDDIEVAHADQLMDDLMAAMARIYTCNGTIARLEKELQ